MMAVASMSRPRRLILIGVGCALLAQVVLWFLKGRHTLEEAVLVEIAAELPKNWEEASWRPTHLLLCDEIVSRVDDAVLTNVEDRLKQAGVVTIRGVDEEASGEVGSETMLLCLRRRRMTPVLATVEIADSVGSVAGYEWRATEVVVFILFRWIPVYRSKFTRSLF